MKFMMEFECDNAAFEDALEKETIGILLEVALNIKHSFKSLPIRDSNGNRIGQYELVTEE